jgi:hypothetical protein
MARNPEEKEKMKLTLQLFTFFCITLLFLFPHAYAADEHSADENSQKLIKEQRFLLLFSGNVRGELEPCG